MELYPIGRIYSSFKQKGDAPHQGRASDAESLIEIFPEYAPGLKNIEEASHLIVLYWGHRADRKVLQAKPPWGKEIRGVFATRSPNRPNPIAFCVGEILQVEGNQIRVKGLDALDGSPVVDIKVYSPEIDAYPEAISVRKKELEGSQ